MIFFNLWNLEELFKLERAQLSYEQKIIHINKLSYIYIKKH